MKQRVVITGLGVLSACGAGWKPLWNACLEHRPALRPATFLPGLMGGEVPEFNPKDYVKNRKNIKLMSRDIQLGVAASKLAFADAGIDPQTLNLAQSGVVLGSGVINNELEELASGYQKAVLPDGTFSMQKFGSEGSPSFFPLWMLKYLPNMPASHITIEYGLRGYSNTVTFSAASGAQAIGEAARVIERGDAEVMLAGGADSKLNPMGISRFQLLKMLSPSGRHEVFSSQADGMVVGEGAGILVLESLEHAMERGAKIYAEVAGFGSAPDKNSSPALHYDGAGKERAMRRAMQDAKISFAELSAVIVNGSGIRAHDLLEEEALKACLIGRMIPLAALKKITGHTVYASGGIESAMAALALHENKFPAEPLAVSGVRSVLINSFGFCGQNTALVFKEFKV